MHLCHAQCPSLWTVVQELRPSGQVNKRARGTSSPTLRDKIFDVGVLASTPRSLAVCNRDVFRMKDAARIQVSTFLTPVVMKESPSTGGY